MTSILRPITILGIESSCDDTGASIIQDGVLLSNCIANQAIHEQYGGVIPELASRAHQINIVPVVAMALEKAGIDQSALSAIAFTKGPGLIGSLLVGASFAKGLALGLNIPLIEVNHLHGHLLAHFIKKPGESFDPPNFPFIGLTVSGGHTQLVRVNGFCDTEVLGETIDDAAGEAFDKTAKMMGLPYPGGPLIDKLAQTGNHRAFSFSHPQVSGFNFSFSGLKTGVQYFIRDQSKTNEHFVQENKADLAASIQKTIIDILIHKLEKCVNATGIKTIGIGGGVSANKGLRMALEQKAQAAGWQLFLPAFEFCTDNAAMIAITGYHKFLQGDFSNQQITASAHFPLNSPNI